MASANIRNIMLRALFEPDFHNLLLTNPDSALKDYTLSDKESEVLKNPGRELYQFLAPSAGEVASATPFGFDPPPPVTTTTTTTITVYIVVAITVFVTAIAATTAEKPSLEVYRPLLNAIRSSSGPGRMDLVKTLINELTKEK